MLMLKQKVTLYFFVDVDKLIIDHYSCCSWQPDSGIGLYRWITAQSPPSTKTNILRIQNHPCFEERIGSSYEKYAGQRLSHCSSAVFWERLCSDSRNEMGSQVDLLWVSQPRDGWKQRTVWKIQFLFVRETFWRLHVESTGWNLNF